MKFSPTTPPDPNTPLKTAKIGKSEMGQEKGESYVHEKHRNLKGPHTVCIILDPQYGMSLKKSLYIKSGHSRWAKSGIQDSRH